MLLIPAVLETTTAALTAQIKKMAALGTPHLHIDVMDGEFVASRSDFDPTALRTLTETLRFELHLMVNDPVAEMRRWQTLDSVFRVLFHREAPGDPRRPITFARREGWEVGLAINPDTPLSQAEPYLSRLDVLQFMTVIPGRQGAPFEHEVLKKIKEFTGRGQRPRCAVDGGVNLETAPLLKAAGVEIFNMGSFLTQAPDIKAAYQKLRHSLNDRTK